MTSINDFWRFHPIHDAIANQLDQQDLLECILVSKAFHQSFIPYLWRDIQYLDDEGIELLLGSEALPYHRHHIRSLEIQYNHIEDLLRYVQKDGPFPNLRTFSFTDDEVPHWESDQLSTVIFAGLHLLLRSINGLTQTVSPKFIKGFVGMMEKLVSLEKLTMALKGTIVHRDVASILGACAHLDFLQLFSEEMVGGDFLELDFPRMFQDTRLKGVSWYWVGKGAERVITRFLEYCPALEKLELHMEEPSESLLEDVARTFEYKTPRLQSLNIYGTDKSCKGLAAIVQGAPSLSQLTMELPANPSSVIEAIVSGHGHTLWSLNFANLNGISFQELSTVLGGCPALRNLHARIRWSRPSTTVSWPCAEMTQISFNFDSYQPGTSPDCTPALEGFFRQVGKMTRLKKMTLYGGSGFIEFTEALVKGMEHMGGLIELRDFHFMEGPKWRMTTDELQMVVNRWPKLELFRGLQGNKVRKDCRDVVRALRELSRGREDKTVIE